MKRPRTVCLVVMALVASSCAGGGDPDADLEPTTITTRPATTTTTLATTTTVAEPAPLQLVVSEIVGHWSGDWGEMVLVSDGDEVRGAYAHDEGTVLGTFDGETFRGWWCEAPSRAPDNDAGDVEFTFKQDEDTLILDGRWRYGTQGDMSENWDLVKQATAGPEPLRARLKEADAFCRP